MKTVLALVLLALSGCVTIPTEVVATGKDTYQVGVKGIGFATQGDANMAALTKANAFCTSLGRRIEVAGPAAENGVFGWSPRESTLRFSCVEAP